MTCTEIEELSGAYVLDAVTPQERDAIEAHIAQCPDCIQLIEEMRATIDLLPLSVSQVAPAPQLKGRILAAVQASASSQAPPRVGTLRPMPSLQALPPLSPTQQRRPIVRRRSTTQRWVTPLLAAAAVLFLLLAGGLATWNVALQHDVTALRTNAVTTTTYAIKGTDSAPGVTGDAKYISGKNVDVTIMTVRGLPKLQGQQVYQGWEVQGKQATSVGLLNVQSDGTTATINIAGSVKGNDAVAVSIENGPTATPDAPKGKVIAIGKVNQ